MEGEGPATVGFMKKTIDEVGPAWQGEDEGEKGRIEPSFPQRGSAKITFAQK